MNKDMAEITECVKEAFSYLDKVNTIVLKEHEALLSHELTPKQHLVLKTVHSFGKITINSLSEKLFLSPSSASQLVNKLEKEDYLKREINPDNRREIFVSVDSRGEALFEEYINIDEQIIKKYYSEFTLDEVRQFRALVKKLYRVIEEKNK